MKIKDIIAKLDKSEANSEWVGADSFSYEVSVNNLYDARS